MKRVSTIVAGLAGAVLLAGCETIPPGAERGPHGTMAYEVQVEASEPGARIEANGEVLGNTPVRLKIFGDTDGTFHDFGSEWYVIRALPLSTNQYAQTRAFGTGRWFGPEDRIPDRVYFDMNQKQPEYAPVGVPTYVYPGPPVYYHYGWPYYYSPGFQFYFHHHGHGHGHRHGYYRY
jgi:hypothetical protein